MAEPALLVVDKPGGITSHQVVARARRALGTKKVGHAGTLDPMATGVLLVGVNRATRLLGFLAGFERIAHRAKIGSTRIDQRDIAHKAPLVDGSSTPSRRIA